MRDERTNHKNVRTPFRDAQILNGSPDLLFQNTISERYQGVLWYILQNCPPSRVGIESPRIIIRMLWHRLC